VQILGFGSDVIGDSIFIGYDIMLLDDWCLTFEDSVVISSS